MQEPLNERSVEIAVRVGLSLMFQALLLFLVPRLMSKWSSVEREVRADFDVMIVATLAVAPLVPAFRRASSRTRVILIILSLWPGLWLITVLANELSR